MVFKCHRLNSCFDNGEYKYHQAVQCSYLANHIKIEKSIQNLRIHRENVKLFILAIHCYRP